MDLHKNNFHPLLLSPVLHKIFGYLSLFNQKKCRLVCKTWEEEIRTYIRQTCKVNLTKLVSSFEPSCEDQDQSLLNYYYNNEIDSYKSSTDSLYTESYSGVDDQQSIINSPDKNDDFASLVSGLSKICTGFVIEDNTPATRALLLNDQFKVKYLELRNLIWDFNSVQVLLLRRLPSLEELRLPIQCAEPTPQPSAPSSLSSSRCSSRNSITANTYKMRPTNSPLNNHNNSQYIIESHPKLKIIIVTLTIKDLQHYQHKNTSVTPLLQLLQKTPNLEEIYYPNVVQFTSPFDNPARILFEGIISSNPSFCKLSRLSALKIDTYVCNRDLQILTTKAFPLKTVQITLTPSVATKYLYSFLLTLDKTLESLVLTFRDGFRLTGPFPKIERLKKMAIILWNGYFDHIQNISQLKTLIVVLVEMNELKLDRRQIEEFSRNSQIQELDVHAARTARQEVVCKLINLAPSSVLKRLTIDYVSDIQLQTIYLTLPKSLEELFVLYGGFTATGITGIPENFCLDEYCDKEFYAKGLKKFRSLEDLKCLKYLALTGDLTDFLIVLGVVQCRSLKRLELTPRMSSQVSDKSIRRIAEMKDLEYLSLKNFSDTTEDAWDYLNEKFHGREINIS